MTDQHRTEETRAAPLGQRGFSIWQFVAALAVGGVLMMVVAQGAGLIDAVRVMVTAQQLRGLDAALRGFEDRYRALPGDGVDLHRAFGRPEARFYQGGVFVDRTGNGRIDGDFFDTLSPTGEQYMAWRDLRASGFWAGDAELIGMAAMPDSLFSGGVMGFSAANLGLEDVVCLTNVPGAAARSLDERLDDGVLATGTLRARIRETAPELRSVYPHPGDGAYADDQVYMVCRRWRG
ncbi:hypothetical protein ACM64Y_05075 [Novispirillum sp. DQ9]|uniref:hypothetical protein n=1 Tax=Novispirillum sp. DQ9 TaxID=3398612 RepID=UPI003C7AF4D5